jgi:hypothetical protein
MLVHAGNADPNMQAAVACLGLDPIGDARLLGDQPEQATQDLRAAFGLDREDRAGAGRMRQMHLADSVHACTASTAWPRKMEE